MNVKTLCEKHIRDSRARLERVTALREEAVASGDSAGVAAADLAAAVIRSSIEEALREMGAS